MDTSLKAVWLETIEVENVHLYRLGLNQLRGKWLWGHQSKDEGGRLTSACLMAVRNSVQGLLGNGCFKGWEEDRTADSKLCDTLTDVRLLHLPKGQNREKAFWIIGLLLSFLSSALSPAAHNQRKGQAVAWLQASGAFPGKTKQLSAGAGCSWGPPFPPLRSSLEKLLLY